MAKDDAETDTKWLYCSFCGKSQHEVKKLLAGPSVYICDECLALSLGIFTDSMKRSNLCLLIFHAMAVQSDKEALIFLTPSFCKNYCILAHRKEKLNGDPFSDQTPLLESEQAEPVPKFEYDQTVTR